MRLFQFLAAAIMMAFPPQAQKTATTTTWRSSAAAGSLEANGRTIEEHWLAPSGGSLLGVSRTVAGGKTVEYQFMQIRDTARRLDLHRQTVGAGRSELQGALEHGRRSGLREPAHDFPQRIRYRKAGADALHARIEGTMNGKARGMDFPYTRAACLPAK